VPRYVSAPLTGLLLLLVVFTGSYERVEMIAIILGSFEMIYLVTMFMAEPDAVEVFEGIGTTHFGDSDYNMLIAANIGAVIMPWMIFYQQSAVIDKGLTVKELGHARVDTVVGSVLTQLIMIAIIITTGAALWQTGHSGVKLVSIEEIADSLAPSLGATTAKVLFSMGVIGAGCVASIVVSLAAAWGLGEAGGFAHSLQDKPSEAPWFYLGYALVITSGVIVVILVEDAVALNVWVQVMNATLLPLVLGLLYMLAIKALPEEHRIKGWYAILVGIVFSVVSLIGLTAGMYSIIHQF